MSEYRPRPGEVDEILRRGVRLRYWHAGATGLAVGVLSLAIAVPNVVDRSALEPTHPDVTATATTTATATPDEPSPTTTPVTTPGSPAATTAAPEVGPTATAAPAFRCDKGGNGGATDRGVTASGIELFTTVIPAGLLASPGEDWRRIQDLLVTRANRDGGICGRALHVTTANDTDPGSSGQALRQAMTSTFAIPFIGSRDSLAGVLKDVARTKTPVIGAPTRETTFYDAGWVWPAGVSDADAARLMVREAYQRGARTFGVVFDEKATDAAFDAEVVRLTGRHATKRVDCSKCTDADVVSGVKEMYTDPPDFVGVLLKQHTVAAKWMGQAPSHQSERFPPYGHGGTDLFLNADVRDICGDQCHGLRAWSAYKTTCDYDGYDGDAAHDRYRADLAALDIDETTETAAVYAATQLLLDALRVTGPNLTRERLRGALDSRTLRADITVAESFAGGNDTMRAYILSSNGGSSGCSLGPLARL